MLAILTYVKVRDYYKVINNQRIMSRAVKKPVKIFQIGFSKCGTVTLAVFFRNNGVRAVHHDYGKLALSMYQNYLNGKPIIDPIYQDYIVYTDMENMFINPNINIGMLMFKELDKQYPGSKFILNIRDKKAWLKSRSLQPLNIHDQTTILELNAKLQNTSKDQILTQWSYEWDKHHQAVIEYFKDRPNDLIVFNIEQDPPEKLTAFLKEYLVLDPTLYRQRNKTTEREKWLAEKRNNHSQSKGVGKFNIGWLTKLYEELS